MTKRLLIFLVVLSTGYLLVGQTPTAFQYQAVVRNSAGEVLAEQPVAFRINILHGDLEGESVYTEIHDNDIVTNQFGVVVLEIGNGESSDSWTGIKWADGPYFLKIEVDSEGGSDYIHAGTSQLLSVPYANYAGEAGAVKLVRAEADHDAEEPVFQVQNRDGQVIFAVYETGVVINIDEEAPKGSRAGFAVGGFSAQKDDVITDYLTVHRDSVRIFLEDDPAKGSRGGFAVGGFSSQKQEISQDFMLLTPENFFIWLDQDMAMEKGSRGGFAVGGFSRQKKDDMMGIGTIDYLRITPDSIRMWFDDSAGKGSRAGFAVGGFSAQKSGDTIPYFSIAPDKTSIFINQTGKGDDPFNGFTVGGFDEAGAFRDFLYVTRNNTYVNNTLNAASNILVEGNLSLGGVVDEPTFVDERNDRAYKWVQIGNQIWMAENLRYGPGAKVYDDNSELGVEYGFLYSWEIASGGTSSDANPSGVQGVCPAGWHLPSIAEWEELFTYLGGSEIAGEKMKSKDFWDGTNESRFSAKPGGYGVYDNYMGENYYYNDLGNSTGIWTSTQTEPEGIVNHYVSLGTENSTVNIQNAGDGPDYYELRYVRCVKDKD